MAIVDSIYGEIRGSVGGNTFSRNKGGLYIRSRVKPTDPSSTAQMQRRVAMNNISRLWSTSLSDAQRQAWNEYAEAHPVPSRLGGWLTLSGHQYFCALNTRLALLGASAELAPPTTNAPTGVTATAIGEEISQTINVSFAPAPLPTGHRLICWWTLWRRPGTNPNLRQARILSISQAAQTSPWEINVPTPSTQDARTNLYICTVNGAGQISAFTKVEGVALT